MMCLGLANGVKEPTKVWKERMTPQEALKLLNNVEFKHEYQGEDQYGDMLMRCKDALEKQIPKKPIRREDTTYTFCPCCESNNISDYCADCGQALDWGDLVE